MSSAAQTPPSEKCSDCPYRQSGGHLQPHQTKPTTNDKQSRSYSDRLWSSTSIFFFSPLSSSLVVTFYDHCTRFWSIGPSAPLNPFYTTRCLRSSAAYSQREPPNLHQNSAEHKSSRSQRFEVRQANCTRSRSFNRFSLCRRSLHHRLGTNGSSLPALPSFTSLETKITTHLPLSTSRLLSGSTYSQPSSATNSPVQ